MSDSRYPERSGPGNYDDPVDTPRQAASGHSDDPLAELARLIDEDPFADFNKRRREPTPSQGPAPSRATVTQPPVVVEPESGENAPEDAGSDDPDRYAGTPTRPAYAREEPRAGGTTASDYDALNAPMRREPRPDDPPADDTSDYDSSDYDAPAYGVAPHDPRTAGHASPDDETADHESEDHATPDHDLHDPELLDAEREAREPYVPPAQEPPVRDPSAYREPAAEEPAPHEPAVHELAPHEPASYEPAPYQPVSSRPWTGSARDTYAEPADPDLESVDFGPGDSGPGDSGPVEAAPLEPGFEDSDFDSDAADRLYADLAAASQRVEPTLDPPPASRAGPQSPPVAALARHDPAFDPPFDPGTGLGPAAGAPATEFDFGDLSDRRGSYGETAPQPHDLDDQDYEGDLYERTDPVFDDSGHIPPYDGDGPEETGGRRRGMAIVAGLVGLVVIGGAGAFAYRSFSDAGSSGPAPVIRADKSPAKVQPQQTDAEQAPQQGKLVYDRVSGDGGSGDATLVPREEAVADVGNRQIRMIDPNDGETNGDGLRGAANDTASADSEDLPKRVRTVVVKPDGTIVGEIEAPKPAAPLPPAALPGSAASQAPEVTAPAATAPAAAGPADTSATAAPTDSDDAVPLPRPRPADLAMNQPAAAAPAAPAPAAPAPAPAATPAPAPAPAQAAPAQSNQPGNNFVPPSAPTSRASGGAPIRLVPSQTAPSQTAPAQTAPAQTASTQTAPAQTAATQTASAPATTTFPAGSYVVQVAASRDPQEAQKMAVRITEGYSGALSGYNPAVERADLGDRGIYYRVGVGPLQSQGAANDLCSKLKSAGLDCFVRRN